MYILFLVREVQKATQKLSTQDTGQNQLGSLGFIESALHNLQTLLNSIECDLVVNFDKIQDLVLMHLFPTLRVLTN